MLCCRDVDAGARAADGLRSDTVVVDVRPFDATDASSHTALIDGIAADHGDLDVVILAAGLLGDDEVATVDPVVAYDLAAVNFTGGVAALVATANVLRRQGHGSIVVLSSVAGERVRAANSVYGATKAGLDGFAQGLGDRIAADGVHVLVVRPGFVHSSMTAGLQAGTDVDDARGGGGRDGAWPARSPADRVGAGPAAPGVRHPAPRPRPRLAPPPPRLRFVRRRLGVLLGVGGAHWSRWCAAWVRRPSGARAELRGRRCLECQVCDGVIDAPHRARGTPSAVWHSKPRCGGDPVTAGT